VHELEEGNSFRFDARFDFADVCFESEDIFDKVHDLVEIPLEGSRDVFMHTESPSHGFDYIVLPNPLDHSHISSTCPQPSISPEYSLDVPNDNPMIFDANIDLGYEDKMFNVLGENADNFLSLGYFSGYNASLDPYCISLEDLPRKIIWITCFNPFYDFFMGFDKVKRMPTLFRVVFIIASYLLLSELWS